MTHLACNAPPDLVMGLAPDEARREHKLHKHVGWEHCGIRPVLAARASADTP